MALGSEDVLVAAEQGAVAVIGRLATSNTPISRSSPITARSVRDWMEEEHKVDIGLEWVQDELAALAKRGKIHKVEHPIVWERGLGDPVEQSEPRYELLTATEHAALDDEAP